MVYQKQEHLESTNINNKSNIKSINVEINDSPINLNLWKLIAENNRTEKENKYNKTIRQ